jgi:glycosyltransferase involved in cell wall biosynthesis
VPRQLTLSRTGAGMKIALVAKAVYPIRGGMELHVHNLAQGLAAMGHHVCVFTAAESGQASACAAVNYRVVAGMSTPGLYRMLRKNNFDVVHAHGARSPFSCWALLAGSSIGLRTVFTPHCFYPAQGWTGRWKRRLFDNSLGKSALQKSDYVICLTENDRQDALKHGAAGQRTCIIPNSIQLPRVVDEAESEAFRRRHGLGSFLLTVGRLDRVKRGDFLISAMRELPKDLELVFIGPDAGCLSEWKSCATQLDLGSRVRFLGEVSDEELLRAYAASTAVVMASAYEGLPTVLLEAMALGTPVVAADSGGIRYLIDHEVNGLLYPYGEREIYCAQVRRCLKHDLQKMTTQAREFVRQHYSWEVNTSRIAAVYEQREA